MLSNEHFQSVLLGVAGLTLLAAALFALLALLSLRRMSDRKAMLASLRDEPGNLRRDEHPLYRARARERGENQSRRLCAGLPFGRGELSKRGRCGYQQLARAA